MRFTKAKEGPKGSVIYTDENGDQFVASSGDRNWRNNNPGNLKPGNVSRRNGQIGVVGGFAVFPDPQTGHQALLDSLLTAHGNESLAQMIKVYAPNSENKTSVYLNFLRRRTGVKDGRKIKDFSPSQFEKLWKAIQEMEGRNKPTVSKLSKKRIGKVRKNKKGTIIAYFVDGLGWISKAQGVKLARQGKIDAVVATSRSGGLFLRTRPGTPVEVQLDNLG